MAKLTEQQIETRVTQLVQALQGSSISISDIQEILRRLTRAINELVANKDL